MCTAVCLIKNGPLWRLQDASQHLNFRWILLYNAVWEMSTPSSIFWPTQAGRSHTILNKASSRPNVDEGVLIPHNTLYNKISIKISTLRSTLWVLKWSGLNQIVDQQPLRRTAETALGPRFAILLSENIFYEYH